MENVLEKVDQALDFWHDLPVTKRGAIVAALLGALGYTTSAEALLQEPVYLVIGSVLFALGGILDEWFKKRRGR